MGVYFRGLTYAIDILNACNLRCPSCSYGQMSDVRPRTVMDLETFKKILDKAMGESKIRQLSLTVRSETLLHPQVGEFIREAKSRGLRVFTSTNLNDTRNLESALSAGLDELHVSFSGWKNYEFTHRKGDLNKFWLNLYQLAAYTRHNYKTKIVLLFHVYNNNRDEVERIKGFCDWQGIGFVPIEATFANIERVVKEDYQLGDQKIIDLLQSPPETRLKMFSPSPYCYFQSKQIVIDARGKVFLCCGVYSEEFIIGDFLETPAKILRKRLLKHPFCIKCKSINANQYSCLPDTLKLKNTKETKDYSI